MRRSRRSSSTSPGALGSAAALAAVEPHAYDKAASRPSPMRGPACPTVEPRSAAPPTKRRRGHHRDGGQRTPPWCRAVPPDLIGSERLGILCKGRWSSVPLSPCVRRWAPSLPTFFAWARKFCPPRRARCGVFWISSPAGFALAATMIAGSAGAWGEGRVGADTLLDAAFPPRLPS